MRLAGAVWALFLAFSGSLAASGAGAQEAAASPNPLAGLALEDFGSTLSQPLFTPSRTPPVIEVAVEEPEVVVEEAPPPVEEPPQPPPFKLVGVVTAGDDKVAILTDESTGEVHRLASGEDFEGWTMDMVDTRTVEFQNQTRTTPSPCSRSSRRRPPTPAISRASMRTAFRSSATPSKKSR